MVFKTYDEIAAMKGVNFGSENQGGGASRVVQSTYRKKARKAYTQGYFTKEETQKAIVDGDIAELIARRAHWMDKYAIGQRDDAKNTEDVLDYKQNNFHRVLDEKLNELERAKSEEGLKYILDDMQRSIILTGGKKVRDEEKKFTAEELAAIEEAIEKSKTEYATREAALELQKKQDNIEEGTEEALQIGEEIIQATGAKNEDPQEVGDMVAGELAQLEAEQMMESGALAVDPNFMEPSAPGIGTGLRGDDIRAAREAEEMKEEDERVRQEQQREQAANTMEEAKRQARAAAAQRAADDKAAEERDKERAAETAKREMQSRQRETPAMIPQQPDKVDLIPAARRSAEQKDRYELRDDIEYFLDTFPDMLREEEKAFAKVTKLSDLRKLHRRIMGKLDKTQDQKKRIGIIVDGDDYLTERINQILVKNRFDTLSASDVVTMREEKQQSDTKDYGDFEVRTGPSGRLAVEREPIYTYIPDTKPEIVEAQQDPLPEPVTRLRVRVGDRRYDKATTAKRQFSENPFRKSHPKVTLKYIY